MCACLYVCIRGMCVCVFGVKLLSHQDNPPVAGPGQKSGSSVWGATHPGAPASRQRLQQRPLRMLSTRVTKRGVNTATQEGAVKGLATVRAGTHRSVESAEPGNTTVWGVGTRGGGAPGPARNSSGEWERYGGRQGPRATVPGRGTQQCGSTPTVHEAVTQAVTQASALRPVDRALRRRGGQCRVAGCV